MQQVKSAKLAVAEGTARRQIEKQRRRRPGGFQAIMQPAEERLYDS